jgi:hypothetical protein
MDESGAQAQPRHANHVVFDAAMDETRATLAQWNREPVRVVGRWMLLSLGIAVTMLVSIFIVSLIAKPDLFARIPNIWGAPRVEDALRVLFRNSLVLALHAFVCIAGFMAMRTLPAQAELRHGFDRWIHKYAGPFTMIFVTCATLFSMSTQVIILGHVVADLSFLLGVEQWQLLLTTLPHALLELTAVFLPLAAFLRASRRREWEQLLAATAVTVLVAIPMLIVAAAIEAYVWPSLLRSIIG